MWRGQSVRTLLALTVLAAGVATGRAAQPAGTRPPQSPGDERAVAHTTTTTTTATPGPALPAGEPVLQLWSGGDYHLKSPPTPRFALWEDGTVFLRLHTTPYLGRLPPAEVASLMRTVREAGLFDSPAYVSIVRPDAGSQTLAARDGGRRVHLRYDRLYDDARGIEQSGPPGSPSRGAANDFLGRWYGTVRAIDQVAPDRLDRIHVEPKLTYPTTRPG